jgi:hypothetical protein
LNDPSIKFHDPSLSLEVGNFNSFSDLSIKCQGSCIPDLGQVIIVLDATEGSLLREDPSNQWWKNKP